MWAILAGTAVDSLERFELLRPSIFVATEFLVLVFRGNLSLRAFIRISPGSIGLTSIELDDIGPRVNGANLERPTG